MYCFIQQKLMALCVAYDEVHGISRPASSYDDVEC